MERVRVSELAKQTGKTTTTIYKHMRRLQARLEPHTTRENGVVYLSSEGAEIVRASMQATTTTPTPAAVPPSIQTVPAVDLAPISNRLESMEKALLAVAEELRATRQEVVSLRSENAALKVLLLPAPSKPVEAWRPEPARPDPLEGKNIFQRIFLELFRPDSLRRFAP